MLFIETSLVDLSVPWLDIFLKVIAFLALEHVLLDREGLAIVRVADSQFVHVAEALQELALVLSILVVFVVFVVEGLQHIFRSFFLIDFPFFEELFLDFVELRVGGPS